MSKSKIDWLEMTGGFRVGETEEQFLRRADEINKIKACISAGTATKEQLCKLTELLGTPEEDN